MQVVTTDVIQGPLTIAPIGDLQFASGTASVDHFKRHLDFVMKQPNPVLIGMGDFVDVASPSNRAKIKSAGFYDSVHEALVDSAERQLETVLKLLKGTENHWAGLLEGHHFYEFDDGTTTDTRFAERLGCPFLGTSAFVRVHVGREGTNSHLTCTCFVHHGAGSGVRASAPLNKLESLMSGFDADIYMIGHMSKKATAPVDQLYASRTGNLSHRSKYLVGTGGFSQGYHEGSVSAAGNARGSYVEQGLMKPVTLGAPILTVKIQRTNSKDKLDIHASV